MLNFRTEVFVIAVIQLDNLFLPVTAILNVPMMTITVDLLDISLFIMVNYIIFLFQITLYIYLFILIFVFPVTKCSDTTHQQCIIKKGSS